MCLASIEKYLIFKYLSFCRLLCSGGAGLGWRDQTYLCIVWHSSRDMPRYPYIVYFVNFLSWFKEMVVRMSVAPLKVSIWKLLSLKMMEFSLQIILMSFWPILKCFLSVALPFPVCSWNGGLSQEIIHAYDLSRTIADSKWTFPPFLRTYSDHTGPQRFITRNFTKIHGNNCKTPLIG